MREYLLPENDPNPIDVKEKFGDVYTICAIRGVEVFLNELDDNQCVVFGDGETYHFRLTLKPGCEHINRTNRK